MRKKNFIELLPLNTKTKFDSPRTYSPNKEAKSIYSHSLMMSHILDKLYLFLTEHMYATLTQCILYSVNEGEKKRERRRKGGRQTDKERERRG